jgi:hypothetical protein
MTAESDLTLEIVEETPVELNLVDETPITIELKETGATGAKGDKGDDGDAGVAGADGLSAYEIWLGLGNEGTEQDFIDSLVGGVADEPWVEYNLDGKVVGAVPIAAIPEYIPTSICRIYGQRTGRTFQGVGLLAIPYDADWGEADPFFPIQVPAVLSTDLPFIPHTYPNIPTVGGKTPNVGTFSIINTSESDGSAVQGDAFAIGSVITDFGGGLLDPIFAFFHTKPSAGALENLVFDGNQADLVGRNILIFFGIIYECEYALEDEPA